MQPLLLMFPLGLFALAVVFDVASLTGAPRLLGTVAYWNIVAGLIGGALAAGIVGVDAVSGRPVRVARLGIVGLLLDVGVLVVFAVIALTRLRTLYRGASSWLLLVEGVGLAVAGASMWFAGRFGGAPPVLRQASSRGRPQRVNGR